MLVKKLLIIMKKDKLKGRNMKKIIVGVIIIVVTACFFNYMYDKNQYKFELEGNKYIIETDEGQITMMNEGGSHTDIYYEINLDENIVKRVSENVDYSKVGPGGIPEINKKIMYTKNIDFKMQQEIKMTLAQVLEKEDINDSKNYHCFVITSESIEKTIYNTKTIKILRKLLNKIDELPQ